MGVVFKAWDTRLERFVALKFLPAGLDQDAEARERFVREAKTASSLDHPNICTIHDIGEAGDGQLYICMAFCEGRTLKHRLREGAVPTAEAIAIGRQILRGLGRAHEAGIVHRDVKPANVMLTGRGEVKLVDFGLAKLVDQGGPTRPGTTLGTFAYMSPEQVRGEELDPRSDLWSAGVVLWELIAGRPPFVADSIPALCQAILNRPAPLLGEAVAGVPPELEAVFARLLAPRREDRYPSAAAAERDLSMLVDPAADEAPTLIAAAAPGPSLRRYVRRRYLVAVLAAILLAAASALLVSRPTAEFRHLAVLPFHNLTGDPGRDYVVDGLAAGLITTLSEVAGLQVLSRAEAWSDRGEELAPSQIARRLGVGTLLEGEVRAAGEELLVATKLLDAAGDVLWPNELRGPANDLVGLQRQLGRRLTEVLEIPLTPREQERLARDPTRSFRSYDLYLQGRALLEDPAQAGNPESAIELLEQAIRVDPEFALAYVGMSEARWWIGVRDKDPAALETAEGAARRALEIDPELPAAQVALARVLRGSGRASDSIAALRTILENHPKPQEAQRELGKSYEQAGDLAAAEQAYRGATLLGGSDWYNWNILGSFYWRLGRYDEARSAWEKAVELVPRAISLPQENLATLEISQGRPEAAIAAYDRIHAPVRSARLASNIGTAYYFSERADRWEKAGRYYRQAVRLDPRNDQVRRNLADLLSRIGRRQEALVEYRKALELVEAELATNPESHDLRLRQAFYAARGEECGRALELVAALRPELPDTAQNAHQAAYVYGLCDDPPQALALLRRAIELGASAELIRDEDEFAALRRHREFRALTGG